MSGAKRATSLSDALHAVELFLRRYIAFSSDAQVVAIALWVAHSHCFDQADCSPYLEVTSPEKRSGKTRLLELLEQLVARPWRALLPSEAVLFRKIDRDRPTLLLDEVDTVFGPRADSNHEALRGVLNAANRQGVTVPRVMMEGRRAELLEFNIFCPKVIAGIGRLPDTVADRSIPIRMRRRKATEVVERFRFDVGRAQAEPLRQALEQALQGPSLKHARPALPEPLNDRAQESWEPLLAIADAAGGNWPSRARAAALELSGETDMDTESLGTKLLADIRSVFNQRSVERILTAALLESLRGLDESPWADLHGRPLAPHGMARRLRTYGIAPRLLRIGSEVGRGYLRRSFEDAWARWLPAFSEQASDRYSVTETAGEADQDELAEFQMAAEPPPCNEVTVRAPLQQRGEEEQADVGSNVAAGDPRDDLLGDSALWSALLGRVQSRLDGLEFDDVYGALTALRAAGAMIERTRAGLRLRPPEWSSQEWRDFRARYLEPYAAALNRLAPALDFFNYQPIAQEDL